MSTSKEVVFGHGSPEALSARYQRIRSATIYLCRSLKPEDFVVQSMPDVSPTKWHLAHTTWFFETFVLKEYSEDYTPFHPSYAFLFNSYYVQAGERHARHRRGALTRPTVVDIFRYRAHVDQHMDALLNDRPDLFSGGPACVLEIGLNHEQQHQELFHTDLKYCWFQNPMYPAYSDKPLPLSDQLRPINWQAFEGQLQQIGHDINNGFCFDNELPRHPQYVAEFRITDRLVSNGEFLDFMADGGYERPDLWLADGWAALIARAAVSKQPPAPLYWLQQEGQWLEYTLYGLNKLDPNRPACHLSAYEADAFARWMGCRLPTEFEWEVAAIAHSNIPEDQSPSEDAPLHPQYATRSALKGDVACSLWQWTSSAYSPYPGFQAVDGALGEYNGKFMCNQMTVRGGSCVTAKEHIRASYRSFFYPDARWQFLGLRLAKDVTA